MAEKKVHKKEVPNKAEPTPQVKKIRDLRSTGCSLREIAERLNISRKEVETVLESPTDKFMKDAGKSAGKVLNKVGEKVFKKGK